MVVIECKSSTTEGNDKPVELAVSQHLRNQQEDGIRNLFHYSNLIFALAVNEAKFATTYTSKEFFSVWKEIFCTKDEGVRFADALKEIKNTPLHDTERTTLFKLRFKNVLQHFNLIGN